MLDFSKITSASTSHDPFEHIVVHEAFDRDFLAAVADEVQLIEASRQFRNAQEFQKYTENSWVKLPPLTAQLLGIMNSGEFLDAIGVPFEVSDLVSDPWLLGGGVHRTFQTGYLSVHEDFSRHKILGFSRKLNAIVYLNRSWRPEYGGALELWKAGEAVPSKKIDPTFNTLVVFRTDQRSLHGQPDPYACPAGESRDSVAAYYYSTSVRMPRLSHRSTRYFVRPNSADRARSRIRFGVESFLGSKKRRR